MKDIKTKKKKIKIPQQEWGFGRRWKEGISRGFDYFLFMKCKNKMQKQTKEINILVE